MKLTWTQSGMPHGFLCDTPIHVVYRLEGCLPVKVVKKISNELLVQLVILQAMTPLPLDQILKVKEEYFIAYDNLLDAQDQSKYKLSKIEIAQIVIDSWKTLVERDVCIVHIVCVMGNHVHVILQKVSGTKDIPVGLVLRQHKTWTDRLIQRELGNTTKTWARGYFDRYIRPGSFEVVYNYVLENPSKAGLVPRGTDWPHTWILHSDGI